MDLIGKFETLPQRHQYTLTVIDMLMNYTLNIPLYTKEAYIVVQTYLVYAHFN